MSKQLSLTSIHVSVTITDNSPEVLAALENAKQRALFSIGENAASHAAEYIVQAKRVDTGRMLNSMSHVEGDGYTDVGSDVEYAIYHEIGTSRGISPVRMITRACTQHSEEYKNIVIESLRNA